MKNSIRIPDIQEKMNLFYNCEKSRLERQNKKLNLVNLGSKSLKSLKWIKYPPKNTIYHTNTKFYNTLNDKNNLNKLFLIVDKNNNLFINEWSLRGWCEVVSFDGCNQNGFKKIAVLNISL